MKRTSRGSRAVRSAARSPARSMIGPAVRLDRDPELGRDDVGEARLAHAGRAEEEDVVEGLAAAARGLDGDAQVGDDLGLAHVLVEASRAQGLVEAGVVVHCARPETRRGSVTARHRPERTRRRAPQEVLEARRRRPSRSARSTPRSASGRE